MADEPRPHVLVIGEALVDVVETTDGDVVETPGGSPLNVAVTLARLGVATTVATAVGDDARADTIESHLADSGVVLSDGARRLARTSTAAARMQPDGSARYEFDVEWSLADETVGHPATVVHAGSIGLFLDPGAAVVRRRLQAAAGTPGVLVTLDPNIRPSLLPDPEVVRASLDELLPFAHVVKLSDEDAAWLYPHLDERAVLDLLLQQGPALVAITLGARGCVLAAAPGTYVELPSVTTAVVDTIGAGDAFMGALIHQVLELGVVGDLAARQALWPEEIVQIGTAATRVAGITVSRRGANPPRLHELAHEGAVVGG